MELSKIKVAVEAAALVRHRAGDGFPYDWSLVIDRVLPCLAEECPGWLDTAERDPGVVRNLVRCACGEFRTRLRPLLELRILDVPPIAPGALESFLRAPAPLAWNRLGDTAALSASVWGFLVRRALARPLRVAAVPARTTPAQRRTAELVAGLEVYQGLFFDSEIAFLPGHFLKRNFLPPAVPGALPWVSCGRVAVVVLDALLGRPPWSAVSTEVRAFETLIHEFARRGAGLIVFSSAELVAHKAGPVHYAPDYTSAALRGKIPSTRGTREGHKGRAEPAAEARSVAIEDLLHPSAMDRLWEVLAQGQAYLDAFGSAVRV